MLPPFLHPQTLKKLKAGDLSATHLVTLKFSGI